MSVARSDALVHEHVFLGRDHDRNTRRTMWVVALTAIMMIAEIIAGMAYGSMALLADGFHMATHAGALAVAFFAYRYAKHHARDPRFTFGTGKVGDLAGFGSALVLAVIAIAIGAESVQRLMAPGRVAFDQALAVAAIGLAVNLASAWLLAGHGGEQRAHDQHHGHDHGHHHHGHGHNHAHDNNLRGAYLHVLADALTSVLAIVALAAGKFGGWTWLDPLMGIVGAVVIARWSWSLMKDTAEVLLDRADPQLVAEIREQIEGPADCSVTDLHVWRIGPDAHAAIVSVTTKLDREQIRARLDPVHELAHVTLELHAPANAALSIA
jgi:cation diffusion facilitator family transporter